MKNLLKITCSVFIFFSMLTSVHAENSLGNLEKYNNLFKEDNCIYYNSDCDYYLIKQKEIFDSDLQVQNSAKNNQLIYVVGDKPISTIISDWTTWQIANGQPSAYVPTSMSNGKYYADSIGNDISISISVSFPVGPTSISVGMGLGNTSTGGVICYPENYHVGRRCYLKVRKKFKVIRYAVYCYNMYDGEGTKTLVYYQDFSTQYAYQAGIKLA